MPPTAPSTAALAERAARLRYDDLPPEAVARIEDLFLDSVASALAGGTQRPVKTLLGLAEQMGPAVGPAELLAARRGTSPFFAALVNGAASHSVEQDDLHNGAVLHPGTVVFPAALAACQATGAGGRALIAAAAAGYEVGVRAGRFLGPGHYRVFHTTGTAGTLAAAAATGHVLGLDPDRMLHALGTAGTQAAGLWEFLSDAGDSKPLHAGKAAADGLLAGYAARDGLTGARRILEGERGMAAGMLGDGDPAALTEAWGEPWAVSETSLKHHAACRHIHPAADALLAALAEHGATSDDVNAVRARVHRAALDVCGSPEAPATVHQAKFSLRFVLALIALRGQAQVSDFDEAALTDEALRDFSARVALELDPEVEAAYPERWLGVVEVDLADGRTVRSRVDVPRGDPGNPLTRSDVAAKLRALAAWSGTATPAEVDRLAARAARLHADDDGSLAGLLP